MARLFTSILLFLLLVSGVASAQAPAQQNIQIYGYTGCYLVELAGGQYQGPFWGAQLSGFSVPVDSIPMRFWIYHPAYGLGLLLVRYPGNTDQGNSFTPWSPDMTTAWTAPESQLTVLTEAADYYFPPPTELPLALTLLLPRLCAPPPNAAPHDSGVLDNPGCTVDPALVPESKPRVACRPVDGFTIDHFELELDSRIVLGNRPDNQFRTWQVEGTLCADWRYRGLWHDSQLELVAIRSNNLRYHYSIPVVTGWRSNGAGTAICAFSADLTSVRPRWGDSVDIFLLGLGLPVTPELKRVWPGRYGKILQMQEYATPLEWLAALNAAS